MGWNISHGANQNGEVRRSHTTMEGIPVTDADGEPYTWFARTDGHRNQIAYEWSGVGGRAVRELRKSTCLTLIDPVWGRDDRLWPALANAIR